MIDIWFKHLARLYLPVYSYQSEQMNIVYAGYSARKKNYYVRLLSGIDNKVAYLGKRWFWEIPNLLRKHDIVVSEISRLTMTKFHHIDGYIVPEWASMKININRPIKEIRRESVSDFSDVARLIRKYNLTYEALNDDKSFSGFIEKFYKPYISKRHGQEAVIEDLTALWKSDPKPFLIAVKEAEAIISMALVKKSEEEFFMMRLGILDGNEQYLRHGAIGALYYFSIVEGQKRNCRVMDIGGTRPFIMDPLTKYKIRLNAEFVSDYDVWKEYLWLGINEKSEKAKKFIQDNSFIHLDKDYSIKRSGS